jgi:NitT/TauT family transport system substrate-binding protein
VAREPDAAFEWSKLAGQAVLADHAVQPLVMLKYAARSNGVEWASVEAIDAGAPEEMAHAFRQGRGAYVHLQSPAAHELECAGAGYVVSSVGASMPPVAFSSLCCSRHFATTETLRRFLEAYAEAREWVCTAPAGEVARAEAGFFEGHSMDALAAGIQRYQAVGCWEGGVEIPRDLYEQALNVFQSEGAIARRHPYEEVCLGAI